MLLVWTGISSEAINLGVTALVGGPHLFSTFLTTYADPRFRRSHGPALAVISLLVPTFVVYMSFYHFQILMSVFVFWASLHVLQQNAYLTDVYRRRGSHRDPTWSRLLDYGVLFLSFYPIASLKLVRDDFLLGTIRILIPPVFKSEWTPRLISILFAGVLLAWMAKTWREWRRGGLNGPKTLLIAVTSTLAFIVPSTASGSRLELAFQTVNAWHSIQYLGVIWVVLAVRKERGEPLAPWLAGISGPGRAAWRFYGLCFIFSGALLAVVFELIRRNPWGLTGLQYYYMGVLSALFIHYSLDSYLFFAAGRSEARPDAIPLVVPIQG
jgi:hypothetical protein